MSKVYEQIQKKKFIWGEPIEWHEIGPYIILSFHPWEVEGCDVKMGTPSENTTYHGWIDGKDTNESWPTLETSLAGLIGRKYAGHNNGGVGYYFCKMVDAPPYDSEVK